MGDIINGNFGAEPGDPRATVTHMVPGRVKRLDGLRLPADVVDGDALERLGLPRLPKDQRRDVIAYALEAIARAEAALKTARLALEMEDGNGGDAA
jgi:hypothetical protein